MPLCLTLSDDVARRFAEGDPAITQSVQFAARTASEPSIEIDFLSPNTLAASVTEGVDDDGRPWAQGQIQYNPGAVPHLAPGDRVVGHLANGRSYLMYVGEVAAVYGEGGATFTLSLRTRPEEPILAARRGVPVDTVPFTFTNPQPSAPPPPALPVAQGADRIGAPMQAAPEPRKTAWSHLAPTRL
jgi:hypothetical protein